MGAPAAFSSSTRRRLSSSKGSNSAPEDEERRQVLEAAEKQTAGGSGLHLAAQIVVPGPDRVRARQQILVGAAGAMGVRVGSAAEAPWIRAAAFGWTDPVAQAHGRGPRRIAARGVPGNGQPRAVDAPSAGP